MIKIVNTGAGRVFDSEVIGTGSWVHLTDPTNEELESISEKLDVRMDFLRAALDEEETVRIENEDGQRLILVDIPVVEPQHNAFLYNTLPLGIILTKDNVVTVCLEETNIVEDFWNGRVKNFDLDAQTRFILQILYRNAKKYLQQCKAHPADDLSLKHKIRWWALENAPTIAGLFGRLSLWLDARKQKRLSDT